MLDLTKTSDINELSNMRTYIIHKNLLMISNYTFKVIIYKLIISIKQNICIELTFFIIIN